MDIDSTQQIKIWLALKKRQKTGSTPLAKDQSQTRAKHNNKVESKASPSKRERLNTISKTSPNPPIKNNSP
jgi:hypothetical protein